MKNNNKQNLEEVGYQKRNLQDLDGTLPKRFPLWQQ